MDANRFADRIGSLQPSIIREILKATQGTNVIPFSAGNPSPETFPAAEMGEISREIFEKDYAMALQYGITEGYGPLRELTCARLKDKYHMGKDFDRLIITTGGQQVVDLAAKVMLNEGDTVICEEPSFIGSLNCFRSYNANLVGVPMDSEGIMTDRVEEILRRDPKVKMIYVIPTFQNPTGGEMSLARRKKLVELADKYGVLILEDSPYFELRFAGEQIPSIKSLDDSGCVLYAGSYSKVLSPGMRIGFGLGPEKLLNKMTVCKQVSDVHTNLFFMILVARYLERYSLDDHISRIRDLYRRRSALMCDTLHEYGKELFSFSRPQGGLFLWLSMQKGNGEQLAKIAASRGVAAVPGSAFAVSAGAQDAFMRLNYSLPTDDQIVSGIRVLCEAADEYYASL